MRVEFTNLSHLKAVAKHLSRLTDSLQLSGVQEALARASGYRDWYELSASATNRESPAILSPAAMKAVILRLASDLGAPDGDVQYALAKHRFWPGRPQSLDENLAMRALVWREQIFGPPRRGQPGTIVKVKAHGGPRYAYLRCNGRPSYVIYDTGPGICGDSEAITPRVPAADFVPSCLWLPYGYWTLADGSEVIFSREYYPLWRIMNGVVERLDPWLWITTIKSETHFVSLTGSPYWSHGPSRERAVGHLSVRRIFELPKLVDAMPLLFDPDVDDVSEVVTRLFNGFPRRASLPAYASLNTWLTN